MLNELMSRYPVLLSCRQEIEDAAKAWITCFEAGGKLLICGNGGSSADSDHIVGELMKGFRKKRPLSRQQRQQMKDRNPDLPDAMLDWLQNGLPAMSLGSFSALNSAFANDVDPELIFAQPLMVLGKPADVLLCISTSGNARNVLMAAQVGKALGMTVIGLTGKQGGKLKDLVDICIRVPESETYLAQELHLPVYHYLCAQTEAHFYEE